MGCFDLYPVMANRKSRGRRWIGEHTTQIIAQTQRKFHDVLSPAGVRSERTLHEDWERSGVIEKATAHSNALSSLTYVAREVMRESNLPDKRRREISKQLESIYCELAELWKEEFEYISPWNQAITG